MSSIRPCETPHRSRRPGTTQTSGGERRQTDAVALGRDDLVDVLAVEYGAHSTKLIPIFEGRDKDVYRVEHSGPSWVARCYSTARPLERVEGDAEFLRAVRHLRVEQLVDTVDGRGVSQVDGGAVMVTGFVVGSPAPRHPTALREVAATLAAVGTVEAGLGSRTARRAGSLPAEDLAAARGWLHDVATDIPSTLVEQFNRLARDLAGTVDCETARTGLVHPDCHVGNVIGSSAGPVLFDWEGAGVGPLVAALGWLLFSSAVAGPDRAFDGVDASAVQAIVGGYTEVRTLDDDEMDVLADAIRVRPLVIACRQLRRALQTGNIAAAAGWWSHYPESEQVVRLIGRA